MKVSEIIERFEASPVIAAVRGDLFEAAVNSPVEIIFLMEGSIMDVAEKIKLAHLKNKIIFIHIDLVKGIGKDRSGVEFLASLRADGITSTKAPLIKSAKEFGLASGHCYFAIDSQGVRAIKDMISVVNPDFIEIMPGVVDKVIAKFASFHIPIVAGGLIETKEEITRALSSGAVAVTSGKKELWYL